MPPKQNPSKLNPLQLRTLTVLQALARVPEVCSRGPAAGEVTIERFPQAHGDHVHMGDAVVSQKHMTGLFNEKVWHALERKGLVRADWPHRITLTAEGLAYETGLADSVLQRAAH
jgi:ribosomal protein S19E (S16A)